MTFCILFLERPSYIIVLLVFLSFSLHCPQSAPALSIRMYSVHCLLTRISRHLVEDFSQMWQIFTLVDPSKDSLCEQPMLHKQPSMRIDTMNLFCGIRTEIHV